MELTYIVKSADESIKQILKNEFNMSDRFILKLKNHKSIFINNVSVFINFKIHSGDVLKIIENFKEDSSNIVSNSDINLNILYEDDFLLIVDKPSNLPVHPSILHYEDSLSNAVKYHFDKIGLHKKIRPVNRLDKDTSGIVIFGKNLVTLQELLRLFRERDQIEKRYTLLVRGITSERGEINFPLIKDSEKKIVKVGSLSKGAKPALTRFHRIKAYQCGFSLVEAELLTGRTHQLRVHFASISHPIVGDSKYGDFSVNENFEKMYGLKNQFLHASYFKFCINPPLYT